MKVYEQRNSTEKVAFWEELSMPGRRDRKLGSTEVAFGGCSFSKHFLGTKYIPDTRYSHRDEEKNKDLGEELRKAFQGSWVLRDKWNLPLKLLTA